MMVPIRTSRFDAGRKFRARDGESAHRKTAQGVHRPVRKARAST